jgi:hypothetical protein
LRLTALSRPRVVSCAVCQLRSTPKIVFYMTVRNPQTWSGLLSCLVSSDFELRRTALEDVNTLLVNNFEAAMSLSRLRGWQSWLFDILTDLPRSGAAFNKREPYKSVYAFTLNCFALINAQWLLRVRDPDFGSVIRSSLEKLHAFAGYTNASQHIAHVMLLSLCNVLAKQHKDFHSADDQHFQWVCTLQCVRPLPIARLHAQAADTATSVVLLLLLLLRPLLLCASIRRICGRCAQWCGGSSSAQRTGARPTAHRTARRCPPHSLPTRTALCSPLRHHSAPRRQPAALLLQRTANHRPLREGAAALRQVSNSDHYCARRRQSAPL